MLITKDYLEKHGGATLDKNGNFVQFHSGFQVGIHSFSLISFDKIREEIFEVGTRYTLNERLEDGQYLGLWLDKDTRMLYIDSSIYIEDFEVAVHHGRLNKQKSIYSWFMKKDITI